MRSSSAESWMRRRIPSCKGIAGVPEDVPEDESAAGESGISTDGGAPAKAQAKVREVLDTEYGDGVGGLPGNDDAGSTSAWYVLGALGLYPVAPGGPPVYHLVAPRFDRATIRLPGQHYDGGAFVIEAIDQADDHPFVQSATLNGEPFDRLVLTHDEIVAGGTLSLVLGPEPSTWGTVP